jgi:ComF family protein
MNMQLRLATAASSFLQRCLRQARFPQDCLLCGAANSQALLCAACNAGLPRLPALACPGCALPTLDGGRCGRCIRKPPVFDAACAAIDYRFPADTLIINFKYGKNLALAPLFAAMLSGRVRADPKPDLVIPMPLSAARLRERGFNQAQEIARRVCRELQLPLAANACRKIRDVPPQAALAWKARAANIRGAFACDTDLKDRSVAVIDDVMTTGATMNELAKVLRKRGAKHIAAWVVARALPENVASGGAARV